MRGEILNFWVVNTEWCCRKVVDWIDEHEAIFIDLPRDFESFFKSESKVRKLKESVDVRFSQHLKALDPIIRFAMENDLRIYCYKDSLHSLSENSTSFELLTLVLKARLGKIDLDEWRRAVASDIQDTIEYAEYEANYIAERMGDPSICLNLGEEIEKVLENLGLKTKRVQLYSFNRPIDRIYSLVKEEIKSGEKRDSELLSLIKKHVRFMDDVIEKGYEEACRVWESGV